MTSALRLLLLAPACTWLATDLDFGIVAESDGVLTGELRYVNTGSEPLLVDRVKASCGCTGVGVLADPIAPGDTASVLLTFDPEGRPGRFDKSGRVWMTGSEEPYVLRIHGLVVPSEETLRASFPHGSGAVRYSTALIDAGDMKRGKTRHFFVTAYNTDTSSPHSIVLSLSSPDRRILVSDTPVVIPPGESESLVIQAAIPAGDAKGEVSWSILLTDLADGATADTITLGGRITD